MPQRCGKRTSLGSGKAVAMQWPKIAIFLIAISAGPVWALPSFDEVRRDFRPSEVLVLSREGEVLQRLRQDASVRRGQWLALADVSPALRQAMVLSEDKRFYEHSGVDWRGVSAAAWGNLWNQRTRGASTITMQLAGLLDSPEMGDLRQRPGGRTVVQKLGQTVAAQVLERRWRKDQILEAYLNLVPFRGEIVGLDALSRTLFGKAAHGLDAREAAVAAALVRAPNARPALVAQRACGVLREMQAVGVGAPAVQALPGGQGRAAAAPVQATRVECDALALFTEGALQRRAWAASEGVAPHFARRLLAQQAQAGLPPRMASTLSAPLQRFAVQTLTQHLRELHGRNVEDGALVVLDNASGQVLAWVGSSGSLSQAHEVDGVLAQRQPGSTLKPFLYAQAVQQRRLTAASLIEDSAAHINTGAGLYIPQNYDRRFKGWVSARVALAASLNVPAVRTLAMVGVEDFYQQLAQFGLDLPQPAGYYGYSLALGSSELDLLRLTNAYRALANGGRWQPIAPLVAPLHPAPSAPPAQRQAIGPQAAFIVGDILSDSLARAPTFGLDSVLTTRFWSAVKTGTSKDMRDNWAIGWSQHYTVGVWVGNASGAAMHEVSGSSGAAPVWAQVLGYLHRAQPSLAPPPPAGVVQHSVQFAAGQGLDANRQEWFLSGTEQTRFVRDDNAPRAAPRAASRTAPAGDEKNFAPRIDSPASGTILALDPDIPPAQQRLWLRASSPAVRWRLNGHILGTGAQLAWLPMPGQHVLEIVDAQGRRLDAVTVQVRGAGLSGKPQGKP